MRVRRRQRAALTHLLLLEALDVTVLAAELRSRAGWVSTLLLKTLLEQSNHPAQGLPPPSRVGSARCYWNGYGTQSNIRIISLPAPPHSPADLGRQRRAGRRRRLISRSPR